MISSKAPLCKIYTYSELYTLYIVLDATTTTVTRVVMGLVATDVFVKTTCISMYQDTVKHLINSYFCLLPYSQAKPERVFLHV